MSVIRIKGLVVLVNFVAAVFLFAARADEPPCPSDQHAENGVCICDPGYVLSAGICKKIGLECYNELSINPQIIDFGEVGPGGNSVTRSVQFKNIGQSALTLGAGNINIVTDPGGSGGSFGPASDQETIEVAPGETFEAEVVFTPAETEEEGCALFASGELRLRPALASCEPFTVPLVMRGRCDAPLFCDQSRLSFVKSMVGFDYEKSVTCLNLGREDQTVESVVVEKEGPTAFTAKLEKGKPPVRLAFGEALTLKIGFSPRERGLEGASLVLSLSDGTQMSIPLEGEAVTERPICADGIPDLPAPVLDKDDYHVKLETETPSTYTGDVRAQRFYEGEAPMISDVLVTNEDYSDPACDVGQEGHYAYWRNCNPQSGQFINIHAVPANAEVERWVRSLEVGMAVSVIGYEVDRIDYDDGKWWTDHGCHTLLIEWICDEEKVPPQNAGTTKSAPAAKGDGVRHYVY